MSGKIIGELLRIDRLNRDRLDRSRRSDDRTACHRCHPRSHGIGLYDSLINALIAVKRHDHPRYNQ